MLTVSYCFFIFYLRTLKSKYVVHCTLLPLKGDNYSSRWITSLHKLKIKIYSLNFSPIITYVIHGIMCYQNKAKTFYWRFTLYLMKMKLVMRIHREINIPQITMQVMPALYLLAMLDFLSKANFFSNSNYKMRIQNHNSIIR